MAKEVKKVAFLTAGGLAPCLSSSIGFLIDEYNRVAPKVEMIGYVNGYMGLLKGDSIPVTEEVRKNALVLTKHGGSPIGNSRVKLLRPLHQRLAQEPPASLNPIPAIFLLSFF